VVLSHVVILSDVMFCMQLEPVGVGVFCDVTSSLYILVQSWYNCLLQSMAGNAAFCKHWASKLMKTWKLCSSNSIGCLWQRIGCCWC